MTCGFVVARGIERESTHGLPKAATRLTPRGRRSLEKATVAVRSVELRMLGGMTQNEQSGAFRLLQSMIHSLRDGKEGA